MKFTSKQCLSFDKLIRAIGVDNTVKLSRLYGGTSIYIPKIMPFYKYRRDLEIYSTYKSKKYMPTQLAKKWGLSRGTIYSIIYRMKALEELNQ